MKKRPDLKFEQSTWEQGGLVCGIDEVGRGSFAGPLVVGAVVLKPIRQFDNLTIKQLLFLGINDSKLLSIGQRHMIKKDAQEFILYSAVQYIPVEIINSKGVGFANKLGFRLAASAVKNELRTKSLFFLSDAFMIPGVSEKNQKNIIKGDTLSISIALASIIAKLERDSYMEKVGGKFPLYGFEKHKGYGTLFHRNKIKEYGPCPIHRTQFIRHYTTPLTNL